MSSSVSPKYSIRMSALVVSCLFMSACDSEIHVAWKEEVYRFDGSILVVDREARRAATNFPISSAGNLISETVDYAPMRLHWEGGEFDAPISFDVIDKTAYLVVADAGSTSYCKLHPPGTPKAYFYKSTGDKWLEVKESDVPLNLMRINLSGIAHWKSIELKEGEVFGWKSVRNAMRTGLDDEAPGTIASYIAKSTGFRCK